MMLSKKCVSVLVLLGITFVPGCGTPTEGKEKPAVAAPAEKAAPAPVAKAATAAVTTPAVADEPAPTVEGREDRTTKKPEAPKPAFVFKGKFDAFELGGPSVSDDGRYIVASEYASEDQYIRVIDVTAPKAAPFETRVGAGPSSADGEKKLIAMFKGKSFQPLANYGGAAHDGLGDAKSYVNLPAGRRLFIDFVGKKGTRLVLEEKGKKLFEEFSEVARVAEEDRADEENSYCYSNPTGIHSSADANLVVVAFSPVSHACGESGYYSLFYAAPK